MLEEVLSFTDYLFIFVKSYVLVIVPAFTMR